MKYTKLGKSELNISRICMGCMGFGDSSNGQHGWTVDESATREIIKFGLDKGINFYDTAIAYQNGTSEQYVGRALRDFAKRDDYVIATKFLPRNQEEIDTGISGQKHIENSLNQSLSNLGMDYVDLYIYHMWDYHTPMEEIMEGLDAVVKAGKARYIGISNCFVWQLAKANLSRKPGETSARFEKDAYARFKYDKTADADGRIIDRVLEIANKKGVSMTEVSLAWLLTKVTSPVVGATKLSHVDGAIKAVDLELTKDEIYYLEELYIPHALAGVMAEARSQGDRFH